MYPNKSDLLTQIHSIFQNTALKEKHWNLDFSLIQKSMENAANPENYFPFFKKADIRKLEGRIKKLEDQNDELICIVHFLFQKFGDLVNGHWDAAKNQEEDLYCKMCEPVEAKNKGAPGNFLKKDKPLLTRREKDVFNLLAKGLCAKEIAKILFISETTVISHKRNLKEKFNAKNTVELISNVLTKKAG